MKTLGVRLAAVGVGALLLTAAYNRVPTSNLMVDAATAFLNSLTPEQRAKAVFQFTDDERQNWHFVPIARKGLPLREMTPEQKQVAHALLAAGLSQRGYIKASTIMSLDQVLKVVENGSGPLRDPEGYFFSIFGEPSEKGTWGYRVEGHHVAQNFTIVNGKVTDTPSMFGANPAEIRQGPRKGLRVLSREEDLAYAIMDALTPEQKKVAIVTPDAYKDIITAQTRKAALEGQPSGLSAAKMTAKQFDLLTALVEEYARNMPDQLAEARLESLRKAGKNMFFAWAGTLEKNGPHYYRVQTQKFLIEFDNTQNNANHVHSVWRDFNGDFGLDMLAAHYQASHTLAANLTK